MTQGNGDSYLKIQSDFETDHAFDNLYYTKDNFQLPVTSIKVALGQPCLDPNKEFRPYDYLTYAGEVQNFTYKCSRDERYQ